MNNDIIPIEEKALRLNLQPSIYGVFAEIGAGQEVVNHFYKAGAASGTVAKSISAYDMSVSDSMYGKTNGYVSKERLDSMLSIEYQSLLVNLSSKAPVAHFFAFANTIATTGFEKKNNARGWLGIKYQTAPNLKPRICRIHVIFHTKDATLQRKMIGAIGVNLIYGVYEFKNDPKRFIQSLGDNLEGDLFEINYIECSSNAFHNYDNKKLSFLLVEQGLTRMIMLNAHGEITQPLSTIRKKDLVLIRGRFRPPTKVTLEMFNKTKEQMVEQMRVKEHNIVKVAEITFRCYREDKNLTLDDYINRSELLSKLKIPVVVTNFKYHAELINYFNQFCELSSLNLVLGSDNLTKVLNNPKVHEVGGALNFIKELSSANGKVFLFPQKTEDDYLIGIDQLMLEHKNKMLIEFMKQAELIYEVHNVNLNVLKIKSNVVLSKIRNGHVEWKDMVPSEILHPMIIQNMFRDRPA